MHIELNIRVIWKTRLWGILMYQHVDVVRTNRNAVFVDRESRRRCGKNVL